jgi:predicted TIM-barrel fold metal-dependent hydrolase
MEIIDAHVHYTEHSDRPQGSERDRRPLPVEQLLEDAKNAGVSKIVQVTRETMGYDNRYSFEAAQRFSDRIAGVFGRLDPTSADMPDALARLKAQPEFLGVRVTLRAPRFAGWLSDRTLDPFLAEAGKQRVPVAIFAPGQAKELGEAARRHPATRVLVDHMALRREDSDPFVSWRDTLALADLPNVWVKVSYFPEVAREAYPFVKMQERFKHMFERFGPDRLIWASNYPSSEKACSYKQAVDFPRIECTFLTDADRLKILGQTFLSAVHRDGAGTAG